MTSVACPLCRKSDTFSARSIEIESVLRQWKQLLEMDVSEELKGISQLELRVCRNCLIQFFLPYSVAGSPALYGKLEKFSWYYMPRKWEHDAALEDLQGCANGIEVGCGFGDFVARVIKEKQIPFEGCEQNPSAVETARKNGLSVYLETSQNLAKYQPEFYSAVCSFQVLEHVADPASFLESCCSLLKPGGKLMIGVPNAKSFLRHQFNPLDMPPHHMSRWTNETLEGLQKLFPLKLIRIAYEPLAEFQIGEYIEAHAQHMIKRGNRLLSHPGIRSRLARFIRWSGMRRVLRGQCIYASYVRV